MFKEDGVTLSRGQLYALAGLLYRKLQEAGYRASLSNLDEDHALAIEFEKRYNKCWERIKALPKESVLE